MDNHNETIPMDFSNMKKHKKKKETPNPEQSIETPKIEQSSSSFFENPTTETPNTIHETSSSVIDDEPVYKYEFLLKRCFENTRPETGENKTRIPRIEISRQTKRTFWNNCFDVFAAINPIENKRDIRHFINYLSNEFSSVATINNKEVVFNGRFFENTFENGIRKYVKEYVQCSSCKTLRTKFVVRDNSNKMFMKCDVCNTERLVQKIHQGFIAKT